MPRRVLFQGHHVGWLHDWWLFGEPIEPPDGLMLVDKKNRELVHTDRSVSCKKFTKLNDRRRNFTPTAKPMVLWMYHFIQNVENECGEQFAWTFEWHITSWYCDEESENVIASSQPFWFVTITDLEGKCVHRNFTIAFDATFGELCIVRNPADHTKSFLGAQWREYGKQLDRLVDAIHEHQRIRNFRLKRLGIEIPIR